MGSSRLCFCLQKQQKRDPAWPERWAPWGWRAGESAWADAFSPESRAPKPCPWHQSLPHGVVRLRMGGGGWLWPCSTSGRDGNGEKSDRNGKRTQQEPAGASGNPEYIPTEGEHNVSFVLFYFTRKIFTAQTVTLEIIRG